MIGKIRYGCTEILSSSRARIRGGDVWDDFKIPFHQTFRAQRYIDADRVLKNNPQVKNLVGHSLGGAVVLELQNGRPERTFTRDTYGAPEASIMRPDNEDNHRYRNFLDPVSFLDGGATSTHQITLDPLVGHSYDNLMLTSKNAVLGLKRTCADLEH